MPPQALSFFVDGMRTMRVLTEKQTISGPPRPTQTSGPEAWSTGGAQLATVAGSLVVLTQQYGLSLGERSCLAAGIVLDAKVLTADTAWGKLNLGIDIHLIR